MITMTTSFISASTSSWLTHFDTPEIAIWAMMIACILPSLFTIIAKIQGGFKLSDNQHPRQFLAQLTGAASRADAAQQNSYETLPMFLVSVVVAMLFFVPQLLINTLACLYVLIRIIYGIAYMANLSTFRSILWALSMVCIFMLFFLTLKVA